MLVLEVDVTRGGGSKWRRVEESVPTVFISYAQRDNNPPHEGWALDFAQHLDDALASALRVRGSVVWMDTNNLRAGAGQHGDIARALQDSDALVCVVSGHFVASGYCEAELSHWMNHRGGGQGPDGLFRVDVPTVPDGLPGELERLWGIQFFDEHGVRLRLGLGEAISYEYCKRLGKLAASITEYLDSLRRAPMGGGLIWIAATDDSARSQAHNLAAALRSKQHEARAPFDETQPEGASVCLAVVGVLGERDSLEVPPSIRDALQNEMLRRVVWVPRFRQGVPRWLESLPASVHVSLENQVDFVTSLESLLAADEKREDGPRRLHVVSHLAADSAVDDLKTRAETDGLTVRSSSLRGFVQAARLDSFDSILLATVGGMATDAIVALNQRLGRLSGGSLTRWLWVADGKLQGEVPAGWAVLAGAADEVVARLHHEMVAP